MIEVFITDIQNEAQAYSISSKIQTDILGLKVNFNFNETDIPFPCGHTILRIEGDVINADETIAIVHDLGFKCEVLADKICKQSKGNYGRILGNKF